MPPAVARVHVAGVEIQHQVVNAAIVRDVLRQCVDDERGDDEYGSDFESGDEAENISGSGLKEEEKKQTKNREMILELNGRFGELLGHHGCGCIGFCLKKSLHYSLSDSREEVPFISFVFFSIVLQRRVNF